MLFFLGVRRQVLQILPQPLQARRIGHVKAQNRGGGVLVIRDGQFLKLFLAGRVPNQHLGGNVVHGEPFGEEKGSNGAGPTGRFVRPINKTQDETRLARICVA